MDPITGGLLLGAVDFVIGIIGGSQQRKNMEAEERLEAIKAEQERARLKQIEILSAEKRKNLQTLLITGGSILLLLGGGYLVFFR